LAKICVLSDAHLLYQAEWIEDEKTLRDEAKEVLDNFEMAMHKVVRESPDVIILAGDMFDTKTESGQRVAFREAEKYMLRVRQILAATSKESGCRIIALRGNHDSEPVLKSLEASLDGVFVHPAKKTIKVGDVEIAFMDTHYKTGSYEIPSEEFPRKADILFMHESIPIPNVSAPPRETFVDLCGRFHDVFNGHMHFYGEKILGIENFHQLPAFVPSRRIKNNWMVKYRFEEGKTADSKQPSPFGYLVIRDGNAVFKRVDPMQTIVRVELIGSKANEFISGLQLVYDALQGREDRENLRVWVITNADKITVDRILWDQVSKYTDVKTMDILSERPETLKAPSPEVRQAFGDAAFTRDELVERVLTTMKGRRLELARGILDEIFSPHLLQNRYPNERENFRLLLELLAGGEDVSGSFADRAWALAKG
jgi:Icc-related predicted phosphoesterase